MKHRILLVTQRVETDPLLGERRDALDQRWIQFLHSCNLIPLPLPNHLPSVELLMKTMEPKGILLTGGNHLAPYGGDTPERDNLESWLIQYARNRRVPLLGVCRGMQAIQHAFHIPLESIEGHVDSHQTITIDGKPVVVNSYHHFCTRTTIPELKPWALASDGVIKAIRHVNDPLIGLMWHPERFSPFRIEDQKLFSSFFGVLS